jgi:nucleoredoxin
VQVIFVSSDRDIASFSDYYAKMPWLAIPSDQQNVKETLAQKLKIRGIPALIILDARTGFFITNDARKHVASAAGDVRRGEEVVSSWKKKEALPLDLAILDENSFSVSAILGYFMRNPLFILLLLYALQKAVAWFQN